MFCLRCTFMVSRHFDFFSPPSSKHGCPSPRRNIFPPSFCCNIIQLTVCSRLLLVSSITCTQLERNKPSSRLLSLVGSSGWQTYRVNTSRNNRFSKSYGPRTNFLIYSLGCCTRRDNRTSTLPPSPLLILLRSMACDCFVVHC